MDKRDPRIDPQRGDWTVSRKAVEPLQDQDYFWLVIGRTDDEVVFLDDLGRPNTTDLSSWRRGSTTDEVLHVAE